MRVCVWQLTAFSTRIGKKSVREIREEINNSVDTYARKYLIALLFWTRLVDVPKKEYYQFYNRQSVFECARCDAIVVTSPLLLKSRLANLILLAVPFFLFVLCFIYYSRRCSSRAPNTWSEKCEINNSYTIECDRVRPIKLPSSMTIDKFTCASLTLLTYFGVSFDEQEKS